ncbi:MAG: BLUF domain-containing protein [Burkholderiales bacterium]|nr:BLUF domain-containing protein [Burkholderiales bacterium]
MSIDYPLRELVYVSWLAPDVPLTEIGQIVAASRANNQRAEITGLLLFDGERFCQYLEGPDAPMVRLLGALRRDPRHHRFNLLYECTRNGSRRFADWRMGYASIADERALEELAGESGSRAMQNLLHLVPRFDFGL